MKVKTLEDIQTGLHAPPDEHFHEAMIAVAVSDGARVSTPEAAYQRMLNMRNRMNEDEIILEFVYKWKRLCMGS